MIRYFLFCIFFIVMQLNTAFASIKDDHYFAQLPVQHEGRIKPLDSFARAQLQIFSGKESLPEQTATQWLAETLFDPVQSTARAVFRIDNQNIRHQLGLEERKIPLYRFDELTFGLSRTLPELEKAMALDREDLNQDQKDLITIHENALLYTQILRTFSLLLPLNVSLPERWQKILDKTGESFSYLDLQALEPDVDREVKKIIAKRGLDPKDYTDDERATVTLGWQLKTLRDASSRNELVRIIPPQWQNDNGLWFAPWSLLRDGQGSPQTAPLLSEWKNLALTWQTNNESVWNDLSKKIYHQTLQLQTDSSLGFKLELETLKNKFHLLFLTIIGYALSLVTVLAFIASDRKIFLKTSGLIFSSTIFIHVLAISLRCYLLERPPVGTLYESIIFVAACISIIAAYLNYKKPDGIALLIGALSGVSLGLLAQVFEGSGDTLTLLTAVLNTRFWLATHVICITLGYGWCLVVALLAHVVLFFNAFRKTYDENYHDILHKLSLIALLFTAVGTILGGIWADQSWGRFWGWDPKENGALLIVLWITWLLHGKLSGHIHGNRLLAGYAFLNIIVAAAWIGVNLLGVGLHSYGFIDGLFWGLALFTLIEILIIGGLWLKAEKCEKTLY